MPNNHAGWEDNPDAVKEADWVITVADERAGELDAVAAELEHVGLRVERVLSALGMVCGRADVSCRVAFLQVRGVASVDVQHTYQVAPPDAPTQ